MKPRDYRIVVEGELGPRFAATLGAMRLDAHDGETEIVGRIEDQAELQGILDTLASLGVALVSVAPVDS